MKLPSRVSWILVGVSIALAGISLAFTSGYWLAQMMRPDIQSLQPAANDDSVSPVPTTPGTEPEPLVIDESPVESSGVTWLALTKQTKDQMIPRLKDGLFGTTLGGQLIQSVGLNNMQTDSVKLGTISNGPYDGYTLSEQHLFAGELGGTDYYFYALERVNYRVGAPTDPWLVVLTQYSDIGGDKEFSLTEVKTFLEKIDATTSNMKIDELEFGTKSEMVSGAVLIPVFISYHMGFDAEALQGALSYPIIGKTADGRDLRAYHRLAAADKITFYGYEGGIYTIRNDGHIVWYGLELPFWPTQATNAIPRQSEYIGVPKVTLNAVVNTSSYLKGQPGGCGFSGVANVTEESAIPGLKIIGYVTSDPSIKIYGADYASKAFDDQFTIWNYSRDGKGTREEFSASVPVFYYHDVLGRWLSFMQTDIVAAGECGKPVIYLYPTKTMDVTVNLEPQGGFTKSEPAYNGGWNVTASPDGTLVNHADGLTYPYLFWEGRGGMYESPDKYWVVAKADVNVFLRTTLAKLGLNEKETADFMEFWYPRMQSAPYYQIGFYGTSKMDELAPMSLSVTPDTIIRVLMDYTELSEAAPSNPPKLSKTPVREGFTVLEWGGVLR